MEVAPQTPSAPRWKAHPYWVLQGPATSVALQAVDFAALESDTFSDTGRFVDVRAGAGLTFGAGTKPKLSCGLRRVSVIGGTGDVLTVRLAAGGFAFFPSLERSDAATNVLAGDVVVFTDAGEPFARVRKGSAVDVRERATQGEVTICADPPVCSIEGVAPTPQLTDLYDTGAGHRLDPALEVREATIDYDAPFALTDAFGTVMLEGVRTDRMTVLRETPLVEVVFRPRERTPDDNDIVLHGFLEPAELARIEIEPDLTEHLWEQTIPKGPPFAEPPLFLEDGAWVHSRPDGASRYARTYRPLRIDAVDRTRGDGWVEVLVRSPWGELPGFVREDETSATLSRVVSHQAIPGRLRPADCQP